MAQKFFEDEVEVEVEVDEVEIDEVEVEVISDVKKFDAEIRRLFKFDDEYFYLDRLGQIR